MMHAATLAQFQDDFVRTLLDPDRPAPPAFSVYRNTVMKGCIDALQANYPAVNRLVGEEWFRAAASVFVRHHLPRTPMLVDYGAEFPEFLVRFEPAAELPYLPAVARLDRFWSESHSARDDEPLLAESLAALDPVRLGALRLRPHAAARWIWSDLPAYTIWSRNRAESPATSDIAWQGEGALIVRPEDAVRWIGLDASGCAFLDACARGEPLAQAGAAVAPGELAGLLARLFEAGAFARDTGRK
jgi:hypothetical protein